MVNFELTERPRYPRLPSFYQALGQLGVPAETLEQAIDTALQSEAEIWLAGVDSLLGAHKLIQKLGQPNVRILRTTPYKERDNAAEALLRGALLPEQRHTGLDEAVIDAAALAYVTKFSQGDPMPPDDIALLATLGRSEAWIAARFREALTATAAKEGLPGPQEQDLPNVQAVTDRLHDVLYGEDPKAAALEHIALERALLDPAFTKLEHLLARPDTPAVE